MIRVYQGLAGTTGHRASRLAFVSVALGAVVVCQGLAHAQAQPADAFATAVERAEQAAKATELAVIHERLREVLDCLGGPRGRDFRRVAGAPCPTAGALDTLPPHSANLVRAGKAIALARVAVTLHDVPPTHDVAEAIHAILTEDQRR